MTRTQPGASVWGKVRMRERVRARMRTHLRA